jgi:hypothetical protein
MRTGQALFRFFCCQSLSDVQNSNLRFDFVQKSQRRSEAISRLANAPASQRPAMRGHRTVVVIVVVDFDCVIALILLTILMLCAARADRGEAFVAHVSESKLNIRNQNNNK